MSIVHAPCQPSVDAGAIPRWQTLLEKAPVLLCELDRDGRIVAFSAAWVKLSGRRADELEGRSPLEFLSPDSARDLQRFCGPEGRLGSLREHPLEWIHPDGGILSLKVSTLGWRDAQGETIGSAWVLRDVTDETRLRADLERASRTDPLTGAWTRAWFTEHLRQALNQAPPSAARLCLLLVHLEHFRELNEHGGHAAGDAALCSVMATLRRCLRGEDSIGRLGGACFAVLLSDLDLAQAHPLVERLRQALTDLEISQGHVQRRLQARCSLSALEGGESAEAALSRAERAVSGGRRAIGVSRDPRFQRL